MLPISVVGRCTISHFSCYWLFSVLAKEGKSHKKWMKITTTPDLSHISNKRYQKALTKFERRILMKKLFHSRLLHQQNIHLNKKNNIVFSVKSLKLCFMVITMIAQAQVPVRVQIQKTIQARKRKDKLP